MRMRGHAEVYPDSWLRKEELEEWRKKDPLDRLTKKIFDERLLKADDIEKKRIHFLKEIEEAIQFAKDAPYPDAKELTSDIFYKAS